MVVVTDDTQNTWDDLSVVGKDLPNAISYEALAALKRELREKDCPFFTDDDDYVYYYNKNGKNLDATIHEMLLIKAEDSTISVSGLSTADTSAYFRRLASRYRQFNSGVLSGN